MAEINIRRILYATDFSESSEPACDYALTLCKLTGAKLNVLHVINELIDQRRGRIMSDSFSTFEKEVEIQAVKEMKEFCDKHFDAELSYETETIIGSPFQEIIKRSEALAVDLIIMGTHGRTGIEHVVVGSTAERVVRRSKIPVLTVRSNS